MASGNLHLFRGYEKINTCFKRDAKGNIIEGEWTNEEFEYLSNSKWLASEKIDGTNIHIDIMYDNDTDELLYSINGRTVKAEIPTHLYNKLVEIFNEESIRKYLSSELINYNTTISLYGEGYGKKIQKGNNYIEDDCSFVLYDVWCDGKWLSRNKVLERVANIFNIKCVPLLGVMTLHEAVSRVKDGFVSSISCNREYIAEGLVLTPLVELYSGGMQRIITKIKHSDYVKLYRNCTVK